MPVGNTYTPKKLDPIVKPELSIVQAFPVNALPNGQYTAGTIIALGAGGTWTEWTFAGDPAVLGQATAILQYDMNVSASGVVFGDTSTPERGNVQQSFPAYIAGYFSLDDIKASQAATITVANLAAKQTGLRLKMPKIVELF